MCAKYSVLRQWYYTYIRSPFRGVESTVKHWKEFVFIINIAPRAYPVMQCNNLYEYGLYNNHPLQI